MKYFSFVEENEVPAIDVQFEDLARLLSKNPDLNVERSLLSYCDPIEQIVTISSFWDTYPPTERSLCVKSDIYLRVLGNRVHTDWHAVQKFLSEPWRFPKLARSLFGLCEDIRLEHLVTSDRKGTKKAFKCRKEVLGSYCKAQLPSQIMRNGVCDAFLFLCTMKLSGFELSDTQTGQLLLEQLDSIAELITKITGQILSIDLFQEIESQLGQLTGNDLKTELFTINLPQARIIKPNQDFDSQTREKKLDELNSHSEKEQEQEIPTEKQETWHRETKQKSGSGLQMKLEHGTQSGMRSNEARVTTESPDNVTVMKGRSAKQEMQHDPSASEGQEQRLQTEEDLVLNIKKHSDTFSCVKINTFSHTEQEEDTYRHWLVSLAPVKKRFVRVMGRYVAFKQTEQSSWRSIGKVGRSLIHLVIEADPRIFFKPNQPSQEKDAAFHLLVDCSGSMYDKLEQVKEVVTLCHETFTELRIPHAVSGFWEENTSGVRNESTMYLQEAIPFAACFQPSIGLNITSLKPQLDNRDGYAIRYIANLLTHRSERYKFLFVFSDGDPAADGYTSYGIADTLRAVKWATQRNVHVLHFFISDGPVSKSTLLALNEMYGKNNILIDDPQSMVKRIETVLRRLLYRVL